MIETPESQIYRFMRVGPEQQLTREAEKAVIEVKCPKCGAEHKVQANLGENRPIEGGNIPFPADNKLTCPQCGTEVDLSEPRRQVEAQAKKAVVTQNEEAIP